MIRMPVAGWLAVVVVTVVGCGDSIAGRPVSAGPVADTVPTETTTVPVRPRELRLDGVDPCTLVPQSDWPTFYIEKPGKQLRDETFNSPSCFYVNEVGGFDVTLVQTEGIEAWDEGQRRIKRAEVEPVQGFPSISLMLPNDKSACSVAVDVADGQYLMTMVEINLNDLSRVPEKCDYARQFADAAMRTLVG